MASPETALHPATRLLVARRGTAQLVQVGADRKEFVIACDDQAFDSAIFGFSLQFFHQAAQRPDALRGQLVRAIARGKLQHDAVLIAL